MATHALQKLNIKKLTVDKMSITVEDNYTEYFFKVCPTDMTQVNFQI